MPGLRRRIDEYGGGGIELQQFVVVHVGQHCRIADGPKLPAEELMRKITEIPFVALINGLVIIAVRNGWAKEACANLPCQPFCRLNTYSGSGRVRVCPRERIGSCSISARFS